MKLNLTDGKTLFTMNFDETLDQKWCRQIRSSKQPVSKAFELAKRRYRTFNAKGEPEEGLTGFRPVFGMVALEGLNTEKVEVAS